MAEPLSLGQLGRVLLRYWILILAGIVLGGLLAFGVTRLMTPVYRATAIQLVKGLPGNSSAGSYEAAQYAVSRAKTYPSFVYNSGVLESVRDDLGGTRSVDELREELSVTNPVGTPTLEIAAEGSTAQEAQDKANSAARHLAVFITEIETVGNRSPISVETAVQAWLPTEAAAPKTLVITALGALIGFALATIAALVSSFVRHQRRSAFRQRQAASEAGGGRAGSTAVVAETAPEADAAREDATTAGTTQASQGEAGGASVGASPAEVPADTPAPGEEPAPDQPALVEPHDVEPVTTSVYTTAAPATGWFARDTVAFDPDRDEGDDTDDTVLMDVFADRRTKPARVSDDAVAGTGSDQPDLDKADAHPVRPVEPEFELPSGEDDLYPTVLVDFAGPRTNPTATVGDAVPGTGADRPDLETAHPHPVRPTETEFEFPPGEDDLYPTILVDTFADPRDKPAPGTDDAAAGPDPDGPDPDANGHHAQPVETERRPSSAGDSQRPAADEAAADATDDGPGEVNAREPIAR